MRGVSAKLQISFQVCYKGRYVGEYVADLVVEETLIVELKCVDRFAGEHLAQCINYLKASGLRVALLIISRDPGLNASASSWTSSAATQKASLSERKQPSVPDHLTGLTRTEQTELRMILIDQHISRKSGSSNRWHQKDQAASLSMPAVAERSRIQPRIVLHFFDAHLGRYRDLHPRMRPRHLADRCVNQNLEDSSGKRLGSVDRSPSRRIPAASVQKRPGAIKNGPPAIRNPKRTLRPGGHRRFGSVVLPPAEPPIPSSPPAAEACRQARNAAY